ncbi:hypothetical protein EPI10_015717 [Gossypium australe]|uniref:Uncharacterized protein n=1 Tax=Gossypium australe TaxID=47621 RepID=A0A5B6VLW9_9ROSI|nr:hypothetical protein EPI10_015717 [Gossypium australe]
MVSHPPNCDLGNFTNALMIVKIINLGLEAYISSGIMINDKCIELHKFPSKFEVVSSFRRLVSARF